VPSPIAAEDQVARDRSWLHRGPVLPPSELALLTVTHNSQHELAALLDSIERFVPQAQVVVVDCASSDDTVPLARRRDAGSVLALGENLGFGRGCNLGLAEVTRPVTALVNPDVELLDGSLAAIAWEATRGDAPERLLAPLVLSSDGSRQDTVHPLPGSAADLIRSALPRRRCPARSGSPWLPGAAVARERWDGRWAARWWPAPTRCAAWARSTSASSCTARTWSWGCERAHTGS
jgi:N-acetylglucosaminyl-diphospho-decaprenol L-rhamnosyltransferase